jgi:hypothetical protein
VNIKEGEGVTVPLENISKSKKSSVPKFDATKGGKSG